MTSDAGRRVDIGRWPELVRLAEEVRDTDEPRVLEHDGRDVARIVPIERRTSRARNGRRRSEADREAFLSSAGSWSDVDVDSFILANRESRDRSSRPPVAF